jgi:hypothetical protein
VCMEFKGKGKGTSLPLNALADTEGSRRLRLTLIATKVLSFSALRTGCVYPPGNISGIHFY